MALGVENSRGAGLTLPKTQCSREKCQSRIRRAARGRRREYIICQPVVAQRADVLVGHCVGQPQVARFSLCGVAYGVCRSLSRAGQQLSRQRSRAGSRKRRGGDRGLTGEVRLGGRALSVSSACRQLGRLPAPPPAVGGGPGERTHRIAKPARHLGPKCHNGNRRRSNRRQRRCALWCCSRAKVTEDRRVGDSGEKEGRGKKKGDTHTRRLPKQPGVKRNPVSCEVRYAALLEALYAFAFRSLHMHMLF